jgi:hypothetical protein
MARRRLTTVPGSDPVFQRLTDELRLCILVILLRQHLSLNEPSGGGPIDDTCDPGTRWPPAAAEHPTSRHILDLKVAPRKNDLALRPSGVRAGPKARSAHMSSGAVQTLKNGALFSISITAAASAVGSSGGDSPSSSCRRFTHVWAGLLAESPEATRCVEGFDDFVTAVVDPNATGWNDSSRAWLAPAEDARPLHGT